MTDKKVWKIIKKQLRLIDKLPGYCPPRIEYEAFIKLSNNVKKEEKR